VVIEVSFTEGLSESYVLPLALVGDPAAREVNTTTPHAVLARFEDGRILCDAIHVPEVRAELLRLIARKTTSRARVRLVGSSRDTFDEAVLERALAQSRVVGADQSNTSVVYADTWFLKLFRKFEHGPNPDAEITQFLSEVRGFTHVPPYSGSLKLADPGGEGVLALLAGFTPNQGDGWTFTLDAVERYFERVLETRPAEPVGAVLKEFIGGVYPERAKQLGQRTGEMHMALASGEDRPEFAAEAYSTLYQRSLYQAMRQSAGRVIRHLRRQLPRLPEALRADVAEIVANQARIYASYSGLLSRKIAALKIRVHGDFHLGQVLNTGKDFVILDFEGEPRRSLGERLLKRSPLLDVAGMLRSFDYAAAAALRLETPTDAVRLEPWGRAWADSIAAEFLTSYFATVRGAPFLPSDPADVGLLLKVFVLDKAIYEVGYELSYRPDFLSIPLGAVKRLLSGTEESFGSLKAML